uniref:Uncharacterized protein n=1 Tax=Manihot esculenta TaxID=3983 RepID=A0A2C9VMD9_MANES
MPLIILKGNTFSILININFFNLSLKSSLCSSSTFFSSLSIAAASSVNLNQGKLYFGPTNSSKD